MGERILKPSPHCWVPVAGEARVQTPPSHPPTRWEENSESAPTLLGSVRRGGRGFKPWGARVQTPGGAGSIPGGRGFKPRHRTHQQGGERIQKPSPHCRVPCAHPLSGEWIQKPSPHCWVPLAVGERGFKPRLCTHPQGGKRIQNPSPHCWAPFARGGRGFKPQGARVQFPGGRGVNSRRARLQSGGRILNPPHTAGFLSQGGHGFKARPRTHSQGGERIQNPSPHCRVSFAGRGTGSSPGGRGFKPWGRGFNSQRARVQTPPSR